MARAKSGTIHRSKSKKILKDAKGFRGARSKLYRTAKDARRRALQNSYIDRKRKKRDFRSLWIMRIGAAAKESGISYSRFMDGLKKSGIVLNRKILADLAVNDSETFKKVVEKVKTAAA